MTSEQRLERKARLCAQRKCPLAGRGDARCADCPGPDEFTRRRSCTACRFNGKKHPICFVCPGPNQDFITDGESMVTLGNMENPDSYIDAFSDRTQAEKEPEVEQMVDEIDGTAISRTDGVTRLGTEAESACLELLRMFASMTLVELKILHGMLNGMNTVQIAQRYGCTKQNVSKVWIITTKHFPALTLFNFKNGIKRNNRYAASADYKPGNHRP